MAYWRHIGLDKPKDLTPVLLWDYKDGKCVEVYYYERLSYLPTTPEAFCNERSEYLVGDGFVHWHYMPKDPLLDSPFYTVNGEKYYYYTNHIVVKVLNHGSKYRVYFVPAHAKFRLVLGWGYCVNQHGYCSYENARRHAARLENVVDWSKVETSEDANGEWNVCIEAASGLGVTWEEVKEKATAISEEEEKKQEEERRAANL